MVARQLVDPFSSVEVTTMGWAVVVEFGKAAADLYGAFDDFDKHTKAAEKAANGKNPYPADDKAEAQLNKLDQLTKKLEQRAKSAPGDPPGLKNVNLDDVDKPDKRKNARETIKSNMTVLLAASEESEKQVEKLRKLQSDAKTRAAAAADISKKFEKLAKAKIPPVVQTAAWESSRVFERARVALVGVENAAEAAANSLDKARQDAFSEFQSLTKFWADHNLSDDEN
jgi:hypothetical protein